MHWDTAVATRREYFDGTRAYGWSYFTDSAKYANIEGFKHRLNKQATLTPGNRFRNMRDAFCARAGYSLTGRHVLVIDDVMTTGATMNEVARVLKKIGAASVSVAVVARGYGLLEDARFVAPARSSTQHNLQQV